jgi:hypothetical protein
MLAQGRRLRKLASQPAEQAHLGGLDCHRPTVVRAGCERSLKANVVVTRASSVW